MGTTSAAPAISFNKRECLNLNEIGETSFPLPDEADAHALLLLGDVVLAVVVLVALKTRSEKMLMLP